MDPGAKVPWHGPVMQTALFLALERFLATDADVILLFAGSSRKRFGIKFKADLIQRRTAVDLSETLGAPSIGLHVENRFRIVVFGPHPTAFLYRKRDDQQDVEFEALQQLTASLRAVHLVITGDTCSSSTHLRLGSLANCGQFLGRGKLQKAA
ncbi:hypothetical protein CF326_g8688 [Tilletia indica]|nr:hypothetical protein CF326_g8688 [Tilletia indica]